MKWKKATKSAWYGLPWPGSYKDTPGYSNGLYFICKIHRCWSVTYITESGKLMGIGKPLPTGYKTSDFPTLKAAKEAVSRLYEHGLHDIPDDPDDKFREDFTRVLLGK